MAGEDPLVRGIWIGEDQVMVPPPIASLVGLLDGGMAGEEVDGVVA